MDASEDTENDSTSGSEEEEAVPDRKLSQQTESEADSEEEEEPTPAAPAQAAIKRKAEPGAPRAKRAKTGAGPKGATTAYIYYWQDAQPTLKSEHPDVPHKELARLCGQKWKALSATEKQPFIDRANADRARYQAERDAGGGVAEAKAATNSGAPKPSKKAAFILFCKESRGPLKQAFPGHSPAEYRRLLGERWKALSSEERKSYAERSSSSAVLIGGNVVGQIDDLLAVLRKRVEARMLRGDIGYHEMKGLLEIVCKSSNYELLRRLDAYPSTPSET